MRQFSLRHLLMLFCLLGVLFGVVGFYMRLKEARRRSAAVVLQARGYVEHAFLSAGIETAVFEYSGIEDCKLTELAKTLEKEAGLRRLSLSHTNITDAGLASLAQLQQVRDLRLDRTAVTDAGMESISHLTALEKLSLGHTDVTGEGILRLKTLGSLRSLNLSGTSIGDDAIEHLHFFGASLEVLNISETSVTSEGLQRLTYLRRLRELDISKTRIDDDAIHWISKLTGLRVLYIDSLSLDRKSLDCLEARNPHLVVRVTEFGNRH